MYRVHFTIRLQHMHDFNFEIEKWTGGGGGGV
jgi:hypothetical protein